VWYTDTDSSQWVDAAPAGVNFEEIASNVIPTNDATYSLGNASNRWTNLYLSGNITTLGSGNIVNLTATTSDIATLNVTTGDIETLTVTTGNIVNLTANTSNIATLNVTTGNIVNLTANTANVVTLTIDGLASNCVVWTQAGTGELGVDSLFKYDGVSAELEAEFKTKYVEFTYTGTFANTVVPDWTNGTVQTFTVTNNFTLNAPANLPVGGSMTLIIKQDSVGNRAMTPESGQYIFASGINTLTTTANAVDMLNIFNSGNVYMASLTTDYI
jgi:hypothetical protein